MTHRSLGIEIDSIERPGGRFSERRVFRGRVRGGADAAAEAERAAESSEETYFLGSSDENGANA